MPPAPTTVAPPHHGRRAASIIISSAVIVLALLVLALLIFETPTGAMSDEAEALLRLHESTEQFWFVPPVLALLLTAGLPRNGDLHHLPSILGWTALGLLALCHLMSTVVAGDLPSISRLGL